MFVDGMILHRISIRLNYYERYSVFASDQIICLSKFSRVHISPRFAGVFCFTERTHLNCYFIFKFNAAIASNI